MQISINTGDASKDELTALIALCASLGGRLPVAGLKVGAISVTTGAEGPVVDYEQAAAEDALAEQMGEDVPPPPAVTTATGDVDSKGIPWDARIHSESKATIADGSWRKRRGVDDAVFAEVMAELQGNVGLTGTSGAGITAASPVGTATSTASAATEVPAPPAPNDDTPPPPPVPADPPSESAVAAPAAGPNLSAFADFPAFVSAVSKHGKSYAELNELSGSVGVAAFKDMKDHADKWDLFFSMLG